MKILIVLLTISLFILLFKFAGGSLSLKDLNIFSFMFYNLFFFDIVGASLIYLGAQKHYLIVKMFDKGNIEKTYYILVYTLLMLPFVIAMINACLYKRGIKNEIIAYIKKKTELGYNTNRLFLLTILFSIPAIGAVVYTFLNIGYIPLFSMVLDKINVGTASIENAREFAGNEYIKNLGMSFLTPAMSYFVFIVARTKKERKWYLLFLPLFVASILAKTYDFSKAPVIYYLFYFYIIEVMLGHIHSIKKIIPYITVAMVFIIYIYIVVLNEGGNILTLYFGPIGRILFTQVATLFLHIDAFPQKIPFLNGASFSSKFKWIFENASFQRSGRIVMEIYSPEAVAEGTAGVMNTLFVGEAYANFGIIGVLVAPIIFGVIIAIFMFIVLMARKTPVTIFFYVEMMQLLMTFVQGGFVDIFYNALTILLILIMIALSYGPRLRWKSDL